MADDLHVTVFADDRRLESLAAYTDGLEELAAVFTDASVGDGELLDRRPAPDSWSVGEILHHLADTELHHAVRLRQLLVEDNPAWLHWDEGQYAAALDYDVRPPGDALTLILAIRNVNARLLASLSPEQWNRTAIHAVKGEVDLAEWVRLTTTHLKEHVLQARRAVIGMI